MERRYNLPENVGDLTKFVLIGRERLVAMKAEIRAIDKVGLASDVAKQKREETEMLADILIDAEVKIGELLEPIEHRGGKSDRSSIGRTSNPLPEGINKKQSHYFQKMANNKDVVEWVKAEAKKQDKIVTRDKVLKEIKKQERKEDVITPDLPDGFFEVFYADPPWKYEHPVSISREIEQHYPTMTHSKLINNHANR